MVVASSRAASSASLYPATAWASGVAMNRVPTQTPAAPSARAAASPRPSKMPPAATTGTRSPTASTIRGHERHGGDETGVPTRLGALGDDEVAARVDGPLGVDHLAAHVGHQDVVAVTEIDHRGRHAESGDEDRCAALDQKLDALDEVTGRSQQVDPEGTVGRRAHRRDLSRHLLVRHSRGPEAAEATGGRDRGHERGVGDAAHSRQHDRMLDAQSFRECRAHAAFLPAHAPGGRPRAGRARRNCSASNVRFRVGPSAPGASRRHRSPVRNLLSWSTPSSPPSAVGPSGSDGSSSSCGCWGPVSRCTPCRRCPARSTTTTAHSCPTRHPATRPPSWPSR